MAYIVVPYDIRCNCIRAIWELRLMSASADVFAVSAVTVARGFKAVDPERERQLRNFSAHDFLD